MSKNDVFEVGDRVRVVSLNGGIDGMVVGAIGTVTGWDDPDDARDFETIYSVIQDDGAEVAGFYDRFERLNKPHTSEPEPTQIWGEHLADIARALKILSDTTKALAQPAPNGEPGHHSDLEFDYPTRVPINLGGEPTGWTLEYIADWDDWALVIDR